MEWLDDAHLDELEAFGLPLPRVQHWEEIVGVQPRPRLTLELDGPGGGLEALRVAAFFDYGPVSIPVDPQERLPSQRWSAGDVVYEVARDLEAELAALEPLAALGQAFAADSVAAGPFEGIIDALEARLHLFGQVLPALRSAGWAIEYGPLLQAQIVDPDSWYIDAQPEEGEDWFSLELGIEVGGERVNILPAVVRALSHPDAVAKPGTAAPPIEVALDDGRVVVLPADRLRRVIDVLV